MLVFRRSCSIIWLIGLKIVPKILRQTVTQVPIGDELLNYPFR